MGKRKHYSDNSSSESESSDDSYHKERHRKKDKKDSLYEDALNSIPKISMKDYYNKNAEFQYWLKKKKHIYFSDISTEKGKKYFKKFVKKWNNVELSQKYYEGKIKISNSERSRYNWGISKEKNDDIQNDTDEYISFKKKENTDKTKLMKPEDYDQLQIEREESNRNRYLKEKQERKKYRKEQKELLDELVPKPTGREAMLEKRKQITAFHRANADKDFDMEYSDSELMGGDDIKERIRQRDKMNQRKEEMKLKKQAEINMKAEAYRKKEEETINMLRKMAEARFSKQN